MQDVHGLTEDREKKAVGASVACSEQQLADRFVEGTALRGQRAAVGVMGKSPDTLARPSNPLASGARGLLANVAVDSAEIGVSFGSENYPVSHPGLQASRSSSASTSSASRPSPFLAWPRPRRILASASRWSATS